MHDGTRYLSLRVSVTWLVSCAVGIVATIASAASWVGSTNTRQIEQMARMTDALARLEARMEQREARVSAIGQDVSAVRARVDVHESRLNAAEREIDRMKGGR